MSSAFNEYFDTNIIMQFIPKKMLDNLECANCVNEECSSTVEEKSEHILNDFFESPELFISAEFLQAHQDFFK